MQSTESNLRARLEPRAFAEATAAFRRECISFLLQLADMDVAKLAEPEQPGDLLNLSAKLIRFGLLGVVRLKSPLDVAGLAASIQANPQEIAGGLISEVRKLLDATVDGAFYQLRVPDGSRIAFNGQMLRALEEGHHFVTGQRGAPAWRNWKAKDSGYGGQGVFYLHPPDASPDSLVALFMHEVARRLDSEEGILLRRCPREKCRRIFLAGRPNQRFCTRKCSMAENFAEHKKRKGEEYAANHRAAVKMSRMRKAEARERERESATTRKGK